jgi:hypothetical protein
MDTPDKQEKQKRAEAAFERVWQNFRLDKARLRTLNEKEKEELKALMKTVFLSSMAIDGTVTEVQEINLNLEGGEVNQEEVEGTVRKVLREELGGLTGLLEEIKNRPAETRVIEGGGGKSVSEAQEVVDLHEAMFSADINTNIDNVNVDQGEAQSVKKNLEALRKLQQKKEED